MAVSAQSPLFRQLLLLNIALMVALEFVQNGIVSFSAAYISGGVGAAPEEFSLVAAVYAGTAIVMISMHRWLVDHLGYRTFIRASLLLFALGALACALADGVRELIIGRVIQALGGSAFFTAARMQVNRFPGPERVEAIRYLVYGLIGGSAMAPWLASLLLSHASWPAVFLGPLLLVFPVAILSELTLEERLAGGSRARLHPGSMLLLAGAAFGLQYAVERAPYDFYSDGIRIGLCVLLALPCLLFYCRSQYGRAHALLPFDRFMSDRYVAGLLFYGICYLVLSSCNYMLPVTLQRGLGFPVLSTGMILSVTSLVSVVMALGHIVLVRRFPMQRKYLVAAFAMLAFFGMDLSRISPDISLWQLVPPLLALAAFSAIGQGTAGLNTFVGLDDAVFSQAYQTKNMLRELLNSSGISLATVLLQARTTVHYTRIAERIDDGSLIWGGLEVPRAGSSGLAAWQQLAGQVTQQSTLMACLDFFFLIGCLGTGCVLLSMLQRRFR